MTTECIANLVPDDGSRLSAKNLSEIAIAIAEEFPPGELTEWELTTIGDSGIVVSARAESLENFVDIVAEVLGVLDATTGVRLTVDDYDYCQNW